MAERSVGKGASLPQGCQKEALRDLYPQIDRRKELEQAFNSLDAQREACAAFILSQKHEGWTVFPALYDDGGVFGRHAWSGRPCRRLIADIEAGKIDVIVVYKVDRLTRVALRLRQARRSL